MLGRHRRALDVLRRSGADALLTGDPGTVAWLTGHATAIDVGPSPFAVGPFALLDRDGAIVLVASEDEAPEVDVEVVSFPGFALDGFDRVGPARRALAPLIDGRRLALDAGAVPAGVLEAAGGWTDIGAELLAARMVKDPDELDRLRTAVELCDAGQAAVRAALEPGVGELELWVAARAAIDARAGAVTPLLADLVSGARTAHVGGPPTNRQVAAGELVLCDLVPRHHGVWGDSCATFAAGEPSDWAVSAHRRAMAALDAALDAVRPGVTAGAIDALVRERLGGPLPHHAGHGLGAWSHEEPRLVPDAHTRLEEGMVLAIEPGVYGEEEGVRVERVVLVTAGGCELLSGHDLGL